MTKDGKARGTLLFWKLQPVHICVILSFLSLGGCGLEEENGGYKDMTEYVHPELGTFLGESGEWVGLQPITIQATNHSHKHVIIVNEDGPPSEQQFEALIGLLNAPHALGDAISRAIFDAYTGTIRQDYLDRREAEKELGDAYVTARKEQLPAINNAADVWHVIDSLYSVWVNEDSTITLDYTPIFDDEHELNVLLNGSQVVRVWIE